MVRFALNLNYLLPTAYHAASNFIALLSKRILCDYTHIMAVESGISNEVIDCLKSDMKFEECSSSQKKSECSWMK